MGGSSPEVSFGFLFRYFRLRIRSKFWLNFRHFIQVYVKTSSVSNVVQLRSSSSSLYQLFVSAATPCLVEQEKNLRTILCKDQTSWEMKIFNPLQMLHVVRHSGGMHKNALFKGCSTLVAMVTTVACSRPGTSFSYKNVAYIVTSFFHFDVFNFPWE